ncbi:MAG: heme biosynthesis protein HemY [Gammaproteobacteria bacterium]|nr:heme biosynthesis protein HemY [Gammaproteobacteria bacterium]NIR97755.1 heme biosynthesis protein HemY [Gammaproteobacteria bacterium]NIT63465.1 heme biosynthesis protein HemY [Gammaproteobacteria bacterium]NIV20397.1 heme biosynthesis protein HemY [Gammaproteobacteria bacterium]NIX10915.1 heme biosynthesis protein HemY [Gammaproteobacteria bacterium]
MKLLILFIIVLTAAVGAALVVLEDPGYVLIRYGPWTAETTLSLFVIALLVAYAALHYLGRLLGGFWRLPRRVHAWQRHRHRDRARASFDRGATALAEGRWRAAERELLRYVRYADAPMLNYLGAARAAQHLGLHERRDRYLREAYQSAPSAEVAVGLTQAELQIAHHQLEQALATLTHLHSVQPRNGYVLRLLVGVYEELRDWRHLREFLPLVRRREIMSESTAQELERQVHAELLHQTAEAGDVEALRVHWRELPRQLREEDDLLLDYARALQAHGAADEAEGLIRGALRKRWNDRLIHLYGLLDTDYPVRQLSLAEEWLKEHGKNPVLLLSLGRLCLRNRLWGKARIYLESSIGLGPRPEAYKELGALLEHMEDQDAAMHCYREGMALAVRESTHEFPEESQAASAKESAGQPEVDSGTRQYPPAASS